MKELVTLCLFWCPGIPGAAFELGSPFSEHMVLQRDMPVPVWGKAGPGATVTVAFSGQTKETTASDSGKWNLSLEPLKASAAPQTFTVSSSSEDQPIEFSDVLVGEVWICSGQSNMRFPVEKVPAIKALAPLAKNIRSFEVPHTVAFAGQETMGGNWQNKIPKSALAFGFSYFLEKAGNLPIGIIHSSWGSSSIEAWMPRDMAADVPHFKTIMKEFESDTKTRTRIKSILDGPRPWSRQDDVFLRRQPNILFNAMMKPLAPYACRGLVWYQGERNTQSMHGMARQPWFSRNSGMLRYADTLQKWIGRYREEWNRDDLEFLIVMLPGYGGLSDSSPVKSQLHPASHSFAWMRESQLSALGLPHTAVANTIDLGDTSNLHPTDKLPVARRLALLAARYTLNQDIEALGPVLEKSELCGDSIRIHFKHASGLTTSDDKDPTGFWLADDSKKWIPATATLGDGTVLLTSEKLEKPLYVRYAFAGKPEVNLVNGAGLPAYPFRTDSFPP